MEIIKNNLTIKPVDAQVFQDPNSPLPSEKATFTKGIVGSKGAGKSSVILNMLLKSEFYKKKFHRVYLCVATVKSDEKWKLVDLDALEGQLMPNDFDEGQLTEWMEDTQEAVENAKAKNKKPPLTLVILDDYASFLDNQTLKHWVLNSRHLKTSFTITSQKFSLMPTWMRSNMDAWVLFPPHSANEKNKIIEEVLSTYLSKKEIDELLKLVWNDPQQFMYVNTRLPKSVMFHQKFNTIKIPTAIERE